MTRRNEAFCPLSDEKSFMIRGGYLICAGIIIYLHGCRSDYAIHEAIILDNYLQCGQCIFSFCGKSRYLLTANRITETVTVGTDPRVGRFGSRESTQMIRSERWTRMRTFSKYWDFHGFRLLSSSWAYFKSLDSDWRASATRK